MATARIAVIGIPGKWSTEVLADALAERTGFRLVIDMREVTADLGRNTLRAGDVDLGALDGIAVKKISETYSAGTLDRLELLRLAEAKGVRVFSRAGTMLRMIDRLACTMTLHNGGIPMPETIVTEDPEQALEAVRRFGEAVFKPLFSTKARGMCVIGGGSGDADIRQEIDAFWHENPMMYIQRKLTLPGRDYGMVFLGGRYLGAYSRIGASETWNTTIHSGGRYERHEPTEETIALAARAESLFGMDFTTVDVADGPDGPIVFEVSAFGGFKGAKEGIGIDAAGLYADHMLREIGR